jgi:hypothetical protein
MPRLGDITHCRGVPDWKLMINRDIAGLDGPGAKRMTHDRRASADVGYRVWNPFEAELRINASGRHDEVLKVFTRVIDVIER